MEDSIVISKKCLEMIVSRPLSDFEYEYITKNITAKRESKDVRFLFARRK